MLSCSLTTMMCFLTKEWYSFPAYTVNLFIKAYHKITYKEDLKRLHKSSVSLRWYTFLCGFGSDVLFTIYHLRSISFFCQNAHHDWLTKEYISNWFLVILSVYFLGVVDLMTTLKNLTNEQTNKQNKTKNNKTKTTPTKNKKNAYENITFRIWRNFQSQTFNIERSKYQSDS